MVVFSTHVQRFQQHFCIDRLQRLHYGSKVVWMTLELQIACFYIYPNVISSKF